MPAIKKQTQLKAAKDRRTKKLAIGGAVVLVALLAIQGPRTMKMLSGPETEAVPAVAAPADVSAPTAEAVPVAAEPVTLATAEAAPEPSDGQLDALGRFDTKDPFVQQVSADVASAGAESAGALASAPSPQTTPSRAPVPSRLSVVSAPKAAPSAGTSAGQPSAAAPSSAAATAGSAVIAINGVEHTVTLKSEFPQDDPTFRLVAVTSTSAKIGIAGGTLANGAGTVTLRLGKTLTLMNTVDGTRYGLQLRSVS